MIEKYPDVQGIIISRYKNTTAVCGIKYTKGNLPVNFSMRVWVSLNVNETDIVVVKKTKSDIMSTPHFVTR